MPDATPTPSDAATPPAPATPQRAGRPWRDGAALLAGLALLALYFVLGARIPKGPAEFVYWPPLEPLPYAPMRGFTWEQLHRTLARFAVLGPALLLLSWPARRLFQRSAPSPATARRLALVASIASVLGASALLFGLLADRALVDDELTYRFQAELLAEGRIFEDTVPRWGAEPFTIWTPRGATGKYLFGEPLMHTLGIRLGLPGSAIHLVFLALTLACWFELMRREASGEVAAWSTVLLAISPMVVLNTATATSQPTCLVAAVTAGLGLSWIRGRREPAGDGAVLGRPDPLSGPGAISREAPTARELWGGALLLGASVGFLATVRPQVALPVGGVLGAWGALSLLRQRRWGQLATLVASAGAFVLAIGLYNQAITGSPLRLPWALFEPVERYGFGQIDPALEYWHTPLKALQNLLVSLIRIDRWWLGWPSSLLLPAIAWWALGRPRRGAGVWVAAGTALLLFNLGYYSPGVSDTGPVYYHELALALAALGGATLAVAFRRFPALTAAVLAVHVALGAGTFWWEQVGRLQRFVTYVHEPAEEMIASLDPPALLLYETAPQESIALGWQLGGFPKRYRRDDDPVVTYPRGNARSAAALRQRYAERDCWYYRVDPETLRPDLRRCEEAEDLLARPARVEGKPLMLQPTALRRQRIELIREP
ncbi:MAG TPA: hypothetical protein VMV46_21625 [Thermoanaerobaculia bacterium]|nr:hypothetical protein [Thermoanaerobaculia bacterium]